MPWFYNKAGQQAGPIEDAEFERLARAGVIQPATLVWREGMQDWEPYANATGAPTAVCVVCRQIHPADTVLRMGGETVCAECKPLYLQRLREGADAAAAGPVGHAGPFHYAGFWIRAAATFLDTILLFVTSLGINMGTGATLREALGLDGGDLTKRDAVLMGVDLLIGAVYETAFVARCGGTPGKLVCRLQVVTAGGERLSFLQSFLRMLAKWVSTLVCGLGYVFAAFDRQKRALHDFICNTRVIWKQT